MATGINDFMETQITELQAACNTAAAIVAPLVALGAGLAIFRKVAGYFTSVDRHRLDDE